MTTKIALMDKGALFQKREKIFFSNCLRTLQIRFLILGAHGPRFSWWSNTSPTYDKLAQCF